MKPVAQRLLPAAALFTALAAGLVPALPDGRWLPAALWHLVFAVGALPMILAAMAYFVPVLTRSGATPRALALAPLTALAAGIGIVGYFWHGTFEMRLASPWLALLAVAGFAAWLTARWRACLGRANPCLAWYAAALGLLALGLAAVAVSPFRPDQAAALRLFHLHINTLGFVGLTALGTLQVLLPTVAGRHDAGAATRLAQDLKWSVGGALTVALGAAWWPPLALAGAAVYTRPLLRLAAHGWRTWRNEIGAAGSSLPLLAAALIGCILALGHGFLHAYDIAAARAALPLFVLAFLLPLVSGAAGQLLPVWLRPGIQNDWHRASRRLLAHGARSRAVLLPLAGLMAVVGLAPGYAIGLIGAAWLGVATLTVVLKKR